MADNCTATTTKGTPCTRPARESGLCYQHGRSEPWPYPASRLTKDVRATIVNCLRAGATIKDSCAVAGIHEATYYRWIEQGEADIEAGKRTEASELCEQTTHARSEARIVAVEHIRTAMPDDWRAAAWYLERSDPENWGKREKVEHSGRLRTEHVEIPDTDEWHERVNAVYARALGSGDEGEGE